MSYNDLEMRIEENISLKGYSTMRLGGPAKFLCEIKNEDELIEALDFANKNSLKIKVIGTGSNLVWQDSGFNGLVIVNKIEYINIDNQIVKIGAGTDWDNAVLETVKSGLSGIEFLSLIPGSSGATPVQNVGAYGKEIKEVLVSLKAYDINEKIFTEINNENCNFEYRSSRFNREDKDRFIITEITLNLTKENPKPPFYESLEKYLSEKSIFNYTPQTIRDAVIAVRTSKLPDPDHIANNGSYFANPIVSLAVIEKLKVEYPNLAFWQYKDGYKISAAWLIEEAGFKDFHDPETGMATWSKQPLVLINESAQSTNDLIKFRDKIIEAVDDKFGITLQQEPEIV